MDVRRVITQLYYCACALCAKDVIPAEVTRRQFCVAFFFRHFFEYLLDEYRCVYKRDRITMPILCLRIDT